MNSNPPRIRILNRRAHHCAQCNPYIVYVVDGKPTRRYRRMHRIGRPHTHRGRRH